MVWQTERREATLGEVAGHWQRALTGKNMAPDSVKAYVGVIERLCRSENVLGPGLGADFPVKYWDEARVEEAVAYLAAGMTRYGRPGKPVGPSTRKTIRVALGNFSDWLKRQKYISQETRFEIHDVLREDAKLPANKVSSKRRRKYDIPSFPQFRRLPEVARDPKEKILILLASGTVLRGSDLRRIRWADVHLDAEQPYIEIDIQKKNNDEPVHQPLYPRLAREMRKYKTWYAEDIAKGGYGALDPEMRVFCHYGENVMDNNAKPGVGGLPRRPELERGEPILAPVARDTRWNSPTRGEYIFTEYASPEQLRKMAQWCLEEVGFSCHDEKGNPNGQGLHTLRRAGITYTKIAAETMGNPHAAMIAQHLARHESITTTEGYFNDSVEERILFDHFNSVDDIFGSEGEEAGVVSLEERRLANGRGEQAL